mmetsp:Transcript_44283/g.104929  ORF Transcript_44283/g.104929 Transcript_44283/m.104929 type:complete len:204 (-) Transcript_44283:932-1543(-)
MIRTGPARNDKNNCDEGFQHVSISFECIQCCRIMKVRLPADLLKNRQSRLFRKRAATVGANGKRNWVFPCRDEERLHSPNVLPIRSFDQLVIVFVSREKKDTRSVALFRGAALGTPQIQTCKAVEKLRLRTVRMRRTLKRRVKGVLAQFLSQVDQLPCCDCRLVQVTSLTFSVGMNIAGQLACKPRIGLIEDWTEKRFREKER